MAAEGWTDQWRRYNANLKQHMKIHTGEKVRNSRGNRRLTRKQPFLCGVEGCGKRFAQAVRGGVAGVD